MPLNDGLTWLIILAAFFAFCILVIVVSRHYERKAREESRKLSDNYVEGLTAMANAITVHAESLRSLAEAIDRNTTAKR